MLLLLFLVLTVVLKVGERLVALENKIDETLTESISVLKQVTHFHLNFHHHFIKIHKLSILKVVHKLDEKVPFLWFSLDFQDYEQKVAGVGQLVSKLSTETTNSANDLETRLQVMIMMVINDHTIFLHLKLPIDLHIELPTYIELPRYIDFIFLSFAWIISVLIWQTALGSHMESLGRTLLEKVAEVGEKWKDVWSVFFEEVCQKWKVKSERGWHRIDRELKNILGLSHLKNLTYFFVTGECDWSCQWHSK